MSPDGQNLPGFMAQQLDFAAHIRNPEVHPRPPDIEPRRMQIYLDLFFNNIESFLAGTFPVAKSLLDPPVWLALVRGFLHGHPSESPYFAEISQEFMTFLSSRAIDAEPVLPACFLELCHYEWVEMALAIDDEPLPEADIEGDLLDDVIVVSPLIWPLGYRFAVHNIGPDHRPDSPPADPTCLVVYRRRDDSVKFMESNAVTNRLIEILSQSQSQTGRQALDQLAEEIGTKPSTIESRTIREQGLATLVRLRDAEIILGTRSS